MAKNDKPSAPTAPAAELPIADALAQAQTESTAPPAPADPLPPQDAPVETPSMDLVPMSKDGVTIDVHPTAVKDHQKIGWVVAE